MTPEQEAIVELLMDIHVGESSIDWASTLLNLTSPDLPVELKC